MLIPKITITGVEEALRDVDARFEAMRDGIEGDLDTFGRDAAQEMVDTHTFQNRTFRLEGSIGYDVTPFGPTNHASVELHAMADYASEVEEGHMGPPAARPYPFFWPVFYKRAPLLDNQLQVTVDNALAGKA